MSSFYHMDHCESDVNRLNK